LHTKLVRDLLHNMANKLACLQGGLESMQLSDIAPGPTRESFLLLQENFTEIRNMFYETHQAFTESYRHSYQTYHGDPPLTDKTKQVLKLGDVIKVPDPGREDLWDAGFQGVVISTTRGDGLICVRDPVDDCWDIDAFRVEKITST